MEPDRGWRAGLAAPLGGLVAQVALLGILHLAVGVGSAGWVVGLACALAVDVGLALGLMRSGCGRLGPADRVTLARATLTVGVAALAADAFDHPTHTTLITTLAVIALALDGVDGWVARRTGTASALGARFDGEVDALLILVLSVHVARTTAWWVIVIGLARYAFFAAGWVSAWMDRPLPTRDWRKVVAVVQGVVLAVASAELVPLVVMRAALLVALGLLVESFGRDVWWLWRRRHAPPDDVGSVRWAGTRDTRARAGPVLTALSLLVVWFALVMPSRSWHLTPSSFVRLPVEGLGLVALAAVAPTLPRRILGWFAGLALALLVVVRLLDMGFFTAFDRPFNPVDDWAYAGIGLETLRDTIGSGRANALVITTIVGLVAVSLVCVACARRVVRVASTDRGRTLAIVGALAALWLALWGFGTRAASSSAAGLAVAKVDTVRDGLRGYAEFAAEIDRDPFAGTPGDRLLTALRGKDVLLVFVESYGRVATEDPRVAPTVTAVLDRGAPRLRAAGFRSRSALLTSPTYGGASWLAHATLQSGTFASSQRRYNQLVTSGRLTLSRAFTRAGWRTLALVPSNDRRWPEGTTFYGYDALYDRRNVGYRGPTYGYASMPDQYTLLALHRLELARPGRPAVFAEIDLVSSHTPWSHIPPVIDWDRVGDGSIFHRLPVDRTPERAVVNDPARARAAYGRSIAYSLQAVIDFVVRYGDDDDVLIVLGDHQPSQVVTGTGATHDVPITILARDPAVMRRIADWRWQDGIAPGPDAPLWRMDAFRDRFLTAFGPAPAPAGQPSP